MSRGVAQAALIGLALVVPPRAAAQTAADLLSLGVRAYQNLDYDAAAAELRRLLGRAAGDTLTAHDRLEALTYLAATELFRGQRDSAVVAFRRLVWLDPTYLPNELIFPPQVTDLFREVRAATKAVAVSVAPVTELHIGTGRFTARLRASSPHDLTVAITRADGTPLRVVYAGGIADSLEVAWDGRTATGAVPAAGRYVLRTTSAGGTDRGAHAVLVPLEITRIDRDAAASRAPVPSEPVAPAVVAVTPGTSIRPLAVGALAAAAVIALPALVARGGAPTPARFVVAAAVGVGGLAGYLTHPRVVSPAPLPAAPVPRFEAKAEDTLIIRAGPPTVFAPEAP